MKRFVIILFVLFVTQSIDSCISDNTKSKSSTNKEIEKEGSECNLIFERGFNDTNVSLIINDKKVYDNNISTNESIEVAEHLVFNSDTIKTMILNIDGKHELTICPNYITTVNYKYENLIIKNLKKFPVYE